MTATFLGKWRLFLPKQDVHFPHWSSDGWASYEPSGGEQNPGWGFCMWYLDGSGGPYPPGKETNIAFIYRTDGQLCFLLNNGQYVGLESDLFLNFVSTLQ